MLKAFLLLLAIALAPTAAQATAYYLSPAGNDGNSGTSSKAPWLTLNHDLACGDTITGAAGHYLSNNLQGIHSIACPNGDQIVLLQCATAFACSASQAGESDYPEPTLNINQSYFGVTGFVFGAAGKYAQDCISIEPPTKNAPLHHILIVNDIASGCVGAGIHSLNYNGASGAGNDYVAIVGNVVYAAASGNGECWSGISINTPTASDRATGTHIYVGYNLSYANVNGSACNGPNDTTDGEGIILDRWDGGGIAGVAPYPGQAVIEHNLLIGNGGPGFEIFRTSDQSGVPSPAHIIVRYNTMVGNLVDANRGGTVNAELLVNGLGRNDVSHVEIEKNVMRTGSAQCGQKVACYGAILGDMDATNRFDGNLADGADGQDYQSDSAADGVVGGHNVFGADPGFASLAIPGTPDCAGQANTHACMAAVWASFTPKAAQAAGFGAAPPAAVRPAAEAKFDALFPRWVCKLALPGGLLEALTDKTCG
jgi:hypothetical protein